MARTAGVRVDEDQQDRLLAPTGFRRNGVNGATGPPQVECRRTRCVHWPDASIPDDVVDQPGDEYLEVGEVRGAYAVKAYARYTLNRFRGPAQNGVYLGPGEAGFGVCGDACPHPCP